MSKMRKEIETSYSEMIRQKVKLYFEKDRIFRINFILGLVVLFLVLWLSTGTLSPYALSAPSELSTNQYVTVNADNWVGVIPGGREALQCRYIANIDHGQFLATFLMLDGIDRSVWEFSEVLRRLLYPIIAYPFMKLMGFETGGAVANFFIHLTVFGIFVSFVKREIGEKSAIFTIWSIATFPGVAYFGGLPYSYAFIFPGCLIMAMLLWFLAKTESNKSIFGLALGIGITSLGYDFLPIFGVASIFILLHRRFFFGIIILIAGILIPTTLANVILKYYFEIPLTNNNSAMYQIIALSYLGIFNSFFSILGIDPNSALGMMLNENAPFPDLNKWLNYIKGFPINLLFNYLFSTFLYLPILFVIANIPKIFGKRLRMNSMEIGILLAVFLVFAFNNLAPPYRSWQMRDFGFARFYEPMFVVLVLYIGRRIETSLDWTLVKRTTFLVLAFLTIFGNIITSFSTIVPNDLGLSLYANFYLYKGENKSQNYNDFKERIKLYGKYPIGTCGHMKDAKVTKN